MARVIRAREEGAQVVLLFDYDGTLAPLARHPALARLPDATRRMLGWLARRPGVTVGVVSGRSLADLERMVGLAGVAYAATSGLEIQVGGRRRTAPGARRLRRLVTLVAQRVRQELGAVRGSWVEDKPLGLAVHYRAVPRRRRAALARRVRRALALFGDTLRIVQGPMALEVVPDVGWTKGTAVRALSGDAPGAPVPPVLVIYAGDAPNDEAAFETVAALGGVGIGVGRDAPRAARVRVGGPAALAGFLRRLRAGLARSRP